MTDSRLPLEGIASIRQLDYTVLLCWNIEVMTAFYRDVMGFPVIETRPSWVAFRSGGPILALRPHGRGYDGDGPLTGGASVHIAFRVAPAQVDVCHRELVAKRVPIFEPPTDQSWGYRTLFFSDPERNVLEIYADI